VSCERTRAVLDARKVAVREERISKKEPLSDAGARALLKSVSEVVIAKGKSTRRLRSSEARLADLRGPTGNFRAPMVRKGRTLLVGFSADALDELIG
jgi:arsenate reductase-like glutaredoxin family protein